MPLLRDCGPDLKRLPDWQPRLNAFVRERRRAAYVYGINDCAVFARDAVLAQTGTDLAPGVELPTSAAAGGRFLIANGVRTIEDLFAQILGASWAHPRQARRGDLVSFFAAGETHMALCLGTAATTPGPTGLHAVLPSMWRRAWKIG